MQSSQTRLGFIIDEHGGIEGIVILEDFNDALKNAVAAILPFACGSLETLSLV